METNSFICAIDAKTLPIVNYEVDLDFVREGVKKFSDKSFGRGTGDRIIGVLDKYSGSYMSAARKLAFIALNGQIAMKDLYEVYQLPRFEVISLIHESGFISPREWRHIETMAKGEWIGKYKTRDKYPFSPGHIQVYEAIADAYADNQPYTAAIDAFIKRMRVFFMGIDQEERLHRTTLYSALAKAIRIVRSARNKEERMFAEEMYNGVVKDIIVYNRDAMQPITAKQIRQAMIDRDTIRPLAH